MAAVSNESWVPLARAVPTLVVAGRYAISARMAGGVKEMLAVTQQLVERVREERAAR